MGSSNLTNPKSCPLRPQHPPQFFEQSYQEKLLHFADNKDQIFNDIEEEENDNSEPFNSYS